MNEKWAFGLRKTVVFIDLKSSVLFNFFDWITWEVKLQVFNQLSEFESDSLILLITFSLGWDWLTSYSKISEYRALRVILLTWIHNLSSAVEELIFHYLFIFSI